MSAGTTGTTGTTAAEPTGMSGRAGWHEATLALLSGLVAASAMFFLIAAFRTPGLDPPPESAALFLIATTMGVIGYRLLRVGSAAGYPVAMLTGGFVLIVVALVVIGTYGPGGPRTNPVGPIWYVALATGVTVTAGAAWRSETTAGTSATPSSTQ